MPDTLEGLAQAVATAQAEGDEATLVALGRQLVPRSDDLRAVLVAGRLTDSYLIGNRVRDFAEGDTGDKLAAGLVRALFRVAADPKITVEWRGRAAKTEALVAGEVEGFTSQDGAFARTLAQAGRTWWIVRAYEAGTDRALGPPARLFTRLGDRWIYLAMPPSRRGG